MCLGEVISVAELKDRLSHPMVAERASVVSEENTAPYLLVALDRTSGKDLEHLVQPSCPIVGVLSRPAVAQMPDCVDVVVRDGEERDLVVRAIEQHPVASTVLVQLLRHNASATVAAGLLAESLAYSTLQQSAEFQTWLGRARKLSDRLGLSQNLKSRMPSRC